MNDDWKKKQTATSKLDYIKHKLSMKLEITNLMVNQILDVGIVTGSTVFGGKDHHATDIDIVIPPDCGIDVNMLHENSIMTGGSDSESSDFTSLYVKTKKGSILNLLIMNKKDKFAEWADATEKCVELYKGYDPLRSILKHKASRVKIFQGLREYYSNGVETVKPLPEPEPETDEMPF